MSDAPVSRITEIRRRPLTCLASNLESTRTAWNAIAFTLRNGDLTQRMTPGTGIRHSDNNDRSAVNPDAGQPLDLIQMRVVPDELEVASGYEQLKMDPSDLQGAERLTAAGERRPGAAEPSEVLIWEMHASLSPATSI